jgi:hypothetical protein
MRNMGQLLALVDNRRDKYTFYVMKNLRHEKSLCVALAQKRGAYLCDVHVTGEHDAMASMQQAPLFSLASSCISQVESVDSATGTVTLSYSGPQKLTFGIELTLKDNPLIKNVVFVQ